MRKMMIAGNWKMNKSPVEAAGLAEKIAGKVGDIRHVDIVICPSFPALTAVYEKIEKSYVRLGAQNLFWEREGAYTGEVSTLMLRESGCRYVIIGHSERRSHFGETDETVSRKAAAALEWNLIPIICVGEKLEERERGEVESVITKQIKGSLAHLNDENIAKIVLAYEPVWAIGTGKTATPAQANEVHGLIRALVGDIFSKEAASELRILYGGSVKPDNIRALIAEEHLDGALVGGASLDEHSFVEIVTGCLPDTSGAEAETGDSQ